MKHTIEIELNEEEEAALRDYSEWAGRSEHEIVPTLTDLILTHTHSCVEECYRRSVDKLAQDARALSYTERRALIGQVETVTKGRKG